MPLPPAPEGMDDIDALVRSLPAPDEQAATAAREREQTLTKPAGSLGEAERIAAWLASWQGRPVPSVERPAVCVFAGSHGVVAHGVSAYPPEVTGQMIANFEAGGAAINQMCRSGGFELKVVDVGAAQPTGDFTVEPAMSPDDFVVAFRTGFESVPEGTDLLGVGEMGIGNTTSAAAVYAALFGGTGRDWVGRGTGVDDRGLDRKVAAVDAGLERHADSLGYPWEVLRRLGGRELVALAGAITRARVARIPVVLDGYVTTAPAAVLQRVEPGALAHCVAGHASAEGRHGRVLELLGLSPLLQWGMRLGEGSGAALAMGLVRTAAEVHAGMATFAEAGVTGAEQISGLR